MGGPKGITLCHFPSHIITFIFSWVTSDRPKSSEYGLALWDSEKIIDLCNDSVIQVLDLKSEVSLWVWLGLTWGFLGRQNSEKFQNFHTSSPNYHSPGEIAIMINSMNSRIFTNSPYILFSWFSWNPFKMSKRLKKWKFWNFSEIWLGFAQEFLGFHN